MVVEMRTEAHVVRVVVVTYSPGEHLARLLESLPAACSAPYTVVIADNGSDDGAPEQAAAQGDALLLRTGGNVGYGAAANRGAAGGTEPFLLVCNPDLVLAPGAVDTLLAAARRWPSAGAFGPAMYTDGELYPSARALPVITHGFGHAVLARTWPSNPFTRRYRQEDLLPVERAAGWLSGACLLVRREAFDKVGGFDPRYFMYFEDVDLGDRLGRAGYPSVYVPQARVDHVGAVSTSRDSLRMARAHHDSAFLYLSDRYPRHWHPFLRAGLRLRRAMVESRGSPLG
jgi:N-acetylglucosaminyl-diphospho-decaprenol L-rhamnosyltransferase